MHSEFIDENIIISDSESESESEKEEIFGKGTLIIGKAGIGKSTYLLKNYSGPECLITAFTGIASARLESRTLSSLFCLGFESRNSVRWASSMIYKQKKHIEMREKSKLVIDEYYTLPKESMEKVNEILKEIRKCNEPFGGMELILIGDDRQTSAVGEPFVGSALYNQIKFNKIVLPYHSKMRLSPTYTKFCNKFRNPDIKTKNIIKLLNDSRFSKEEVPGYIVYHENKHVNDKNKEEMKKFKGKVIGNIRGVEYKEGCPICVINNGKDVFNGMLGKLLSIDEKNKMVEVEFDEYILETKIRDIKFVPAFAMTIHRCQANTFKGVNLYINPEKIKIDKDDFLRLVYTALTRVRSFKNCHIEWLK